MVDSSFRVGLNEDLECIIEFINGSSMWTMVLTEPQLQQVHDGLTDSLKKLKEFKKKAAN